MLTMNIDDTNGYESVRTSSMLSRFLGRRRKSSLARNDQGMDESTLAKIR
jgi:hypothetical protein